MPELNDLHLTRDEANRILEFIGYGSLNARFWFIGLEEGLSSKNPADLQDNLTARGTWPCIIDLAEACLQLRHNRNPIEIVNAPPPRTPTWPWMAKICLRLTDGPASLTKQNVRHYV